MAIVALRGVREATPERGTFFQAVHIQKGRKNVIYVFKRAFKHFKGLLK